MDDGILITNREEPSEQPAKRKRGCFGRCRKQSEDVGEEQEDQFSMVELANKMTVAIVGEICSMKPALQRQVMSSKIFEETTL